MKRLILEIGSGTDLYGQDYTKAALRALHDSLRHSSILMLNALDLSHSDMNVNVTIGVQDPRKVDVEQICNAVDFFIKNRSITGQVISVDSGQSLNWQTPDILGLKE